VKKGRNRRELEDDDADLIAEESTEPDEGLTGADMTARDDEHLHAYVRRRVESLRAGEEVHSHYSIFSYILIGKYKNISLSDFFLMNFFESIRKYTI